MRRIELGGTLAAGLLVVSACSPGGSTGRTPSGFVRAEGSAVSVARPASWHSTAPTSKIMTVAVSSPAEDAEADVLENLLTGANRGTPDMLLDTVEAGPETNARGYHRTRTASTHVSGAKAAVRVDYTFDDARKGPCQAIDVGVLAGNGQIHAVRVIWRRGTLDKKTTDGIIDSIEVSR